MLTNRINLAGFGGWRYVLGITGLCAILIVGTGIRCAHADANLDGTWLLVSVDFKPLKNLPLEKIPFFTVMDMEVYGFDGCNTFSGRIDQSGQISVTRIGCHELAIRLPLDLNDLLSHLKTGMIDNGFLSVPRRAEFPASTFARHKVTPTSRDGYRLKDTVLPAR